MRIVTYHPRAAVGDGGITNSVRRLSEAWARAGAEAVIAYDGTGTAARGTDGICWVPVRHHGPARARIPSGLGEAFEGADLVVLNSGWSPANVVVGGAARRVSVPYVLAPRGAYDPLIVARRGVQKRAWWALFERRLVRSAAAVHVFFPEQATDVSRLGYPGPFVIAPNGVVPIEASWDGGSGGYVLYLGRFDPEHKGIDLLLRALATLPADERPQIRLHGPDWRGGKARVQALADQLAVQRWVSIGGAVYGEDKVQLLIRSLGLVYPSRWEGFGNSLAEAAAAGVPTLATPYPLARFLEARGACITVSHDPVALGEGLIRLCGHEAATVGRRAAVVVATEFDWDTVAAAWLRQLARLELFA